MKYTALLTGCKRDVNTLSPRCLLVDIEYEDGTLFRDHNYVEIDRLEKYMPSANSKKKIKVQFTAEEYIYRSSTGDNIGLRRIRNVQVVQ